MPAQVTTRAQVNGFRFLLRRLEHALIRGDSRMIHDPMRGQMRALLVGVVVSVLVCGAAGVMAFVKPVPNFGQSAIILSKSNGALYVRIGNQLHPALNLASARLIAGRSDPGEVDDKFLNTVPLGAAVGIVGAPSAIHGGDDMTRSSWTVCDATTLPSVDQLAGTATVQTMVLANDPALGADVSEASGDQMVLAEDGQSVFAIYEGVRAKIDPNDPVLSAALHLKDGEIRKVSPGLLNAFPLVDPIVPVIIDGVGEPTSYLPPAYPVGSILNATDSRGEQLYVVMREGVQPISAATADIIRYGTAQSPTAPEPTAVSPAATSGAPVAHTLRVARYPTTSPHFVRTDADPVVCLAWQRAGSNEATSSMLVGKQLPLPDGAQPVSLATADGSGPRLDGVYLKPGTGEYVQATGADPDSRTVGPLFYVSDVGLRFHVQDAATAVALGVEGEPSGNEPAQAPQSAPWSILSLLPPGPKLSQEAALIVHDGIAADRDGTRIALPNG
jgi:type VII secretion protein EccB